MNKLAQHLQKHLRGEVLATHQALDYFSTDGSIFTVKPQVIVYPKNVSDVRKVMKLSHQLAERGKKLPITVRGKGTDQGGAAIGEGVVMVMPAHMNKLVEIEKDSVTVQPGMLYGDLQRTLYSHGRFLPPYPSSMEFSTIGGAVANNASGEKTIKYGSTRDYVKSLQAVLSNGQTITVAPLSKRDLNRKKGQSDLEGEIYRQLDGLLTDNAELIAQARPHVTKNSAGYALWDVRRGDGTFDLGSLLIGSQGTLAAVTEITLRTEAYYPNTHLLAVFFDDIEKAGEAVQKLRPLNPSAMEIVDYHLLDFVRRHQPEHLAGIVDGELPKLIFIVEFDDTKLSVQKRKAKKAQKLLRNLASEIRLTTNPEEQEELWKIRHSAAAVIWQDKGKKKALPIIEDGVVPVEKLTEFLDKAYKLFKKYNLEIAVWGHAGNANFHMQPFLDLDNTTDRQTIFNLMDDFYKMVLAMGGSTCGEHNDGRLRGPYLPDLYGKDIYELFRQVKQVFDPFGILNPGVKIDVNKNNLKKLLRTSYSEKHLYDHMPHITS